MVTTIQLTSKIYKAQILLAYVIVIAGFLGAVWSFWNIDSPPWTMTASLYAIPIGMVWGGAASFLAWWNHG